MKNLALLALVLAGLFGAENSFARVVICCGSDGKVHNYTISGGIGRGWSPEQVLQFRRNLCKENCGGVPSEEGTCRDESDDSSN